MKNFSLTSFLAVFFLLTTSVFAQSPRATPPPSEDILKISTALIQVDATVTDKKGNIVTDLKPEDFEVYENGKKQEISNFSFASIDSKTVPIENVAAPNNSGNKNNKNRIPIPPVKLKAEQVRRTYALVVDDLGLSFESVRHVQQSLKKFTKEQFAKVQEKGIIYDLPVPIVKTGAYQFRVALQDTATGRIGAASQFIEIPNLNKKKLTLSNLIVKQYSLEEWKKISLGQNSNLNSSSNIALLDTITRKFKSGTIFTYTFVIYNARANSGQKPQLQLQARLFRDGKMILESSPSAVDVDGQTDLRRIEVLKAVTLGKNLQPGDYALQIIVSDGSTKEKQQIATQSIDFEIVRQLNPE